MRIPWRIPTLLASSGCIALIGKLLYPLRKLCIFTRALRTAPGASVLELLYEVPLGLLSFRTYHLGRTICNAGAARAKQAELEARKAAPTKEPLAWAHGYQAMDTNYDFFFGAAVIGPRWQTRAVISEATLEVETGFDVDITPLRHPGTVSYSLVVYAPNYGTVAVLGGNSSGSSGKASGPEWKRMPLPKGTYRVILRLYGTDCYEVKDMPLPAIRLDASATEVYVKPSTTSVNTREIFGGLVAKEDYVIKAMQAHIYPMLAWQAYLPASLVRSTVLPVGNPDTAFTYGALHAGSTAVFTLSAAALSDFLLVHVTIYDRASIPTQFFDLPMGTAPYTVPIDEDSIYLVRGVLKQKGSEPILTTIADELNPTADSPTFGSRLTVECVYPKDAPSAKAA